MIYEHLCLHCKYLNTDKEQLLVCPMCSTPGISNTPYAGRGFEDEVELEGELTDTDERELHE